MMKKQEAQELWIDLVNGDIDPAKEKALNTYLDANPEVRAEFEDLRSIWASMETVEIPEPTPSMDEKFYSMMQDLSAWGSQTRPSVFDKLENLIGRMFESRLAFAMMMLIIGGVLGYFLNVGSATQQQLTLLNSEVYEMKKVMMLTLLEQPRATDRLKAVQISNELQQPDEKIIEALLKTLNNDPNVNVRLVAAQSLAAMANHPNVRTGLIEAISKQRSPVVQNALADIMLRLQEKNAVRELEKLLQQENLDTLVKKKIETTIETLI